MSGDLLTWMLEKFTQRLQEQGRVYTSAIQNVLSADTSPTSTDSTAPTGGVLPGTEKDSADVEQ